MGTLSPSPDGQLACLCTKCLPATQCHGSRCFSSVKVIGDQAVFERGCLKGEDNIHLQCSTPPSFHQAIDCCSQDMCNSNATKSQLMSRLPTGDCSGSCFRAVRFSTVFLHLSLGLHRRCLTPSLDNNQGKPENLSEN